MGVSRNHRGGRQWLAATSSHLVLMTAIGVLAVPAVAQSNEALETVVVSGVRESMQSALALKSKSTEVMDSIVAEDIGKLPDSNLSESLTRIPGIQGYRYGGEGASPVGTGSGMTIRGLSGQTATLVDGRSVATAGQRDFNIEDAVPGLIAGVDVYKNPSADHVEGGIGGVINIRSRKALDFSETTFGASVTGRYNDLTKQISPEYYGLVATRWKAGDLGEMGFVISGMYQQSANRSDNNPGSGGAMWMLPVGCDSAVSGSNACANTGYAGQAGVAKLVAVSDPTTFDYSPYAGKSKADVVSFGGYDHSVNNEDILRTRVGMSSSFEWRVSDKLEFYADANYTHYLYNQHYRFLSVANSGNTSYWYSPSPAAGVDGKSNNGIFVKNLTTSAYNITGSMMANRSSATNPAGDAIYSTKRFASGTFLDQTLQSNSGDEHRPYNTLSLGGGTRWNPSDDLEVKADLSYTHSDQDQDNRNAYLYSANGVTFDVTRNSTGAPATVGFASGSNSAGKYLTDDARAWVFQNYSNGTNQHWDDTSGALTLDATYKVHSLPVLTAVKAGFRYFYITDTYNSFAFSGKNLTTDGKALVTSPWLSSYTGFANAIGVANPSYQGLVSTAPGNIFGGQLGYGGGFMVYDAINLLNNSVRSAFPQAGIPDDSGLVALVANYRKAREDTYGGYIMGEFSLFNDFITGNAGVRMVQAHDSTATNVLNDFAAGTAAGYHRNQSTSDTWSFLPSANFNIHWSDELVSRIGLARHVTRPNLSDLNPALTVSTSDDTANIGNPNLKPYSAYSVDASLEYYFGGGAFVGVDLWDKEIKGFFNTVATCTTIAGAPAPTVLSNGCPAGMRWLSQTINSGDGSARGIEVQGQTFFDFLPGFWKHFGVQGSWAYMETSLPAPYLVAKQTYVWHDLPQPFQSKNALTGQLLYDDDNLSGRLVYTYRSDFVLFGVSNQPVSSRTIKGFGLLDGNVSYKIGYGLTMRAGISNILNTAPNRFIGEPGNRTALERQSYDNGRIYSLGLAFKTGE